MEALVSGMGNHELVAQQVVDGLEKTFGTIDSPRSGIINAERLLDNSGGPLSFNELINQKDIIPEATSSSERLVDENFEITEELLRKRIAEVAVMVYPGYQSVDQRLKITSEEELARLRQGARDGTLSIMDFHIGSNELYDHPNRRTPRADVVNRDTVYGPDKKFARAYSYPFYKTKEGRPLHPFFDVMLQYGAVVGPGFYYGLGYTSAGDGIAPAIIKDKKGNPHLYICALERTDTHDPAFLGGIVEPEEFDSDGVPISIINVIKREMHEEMGGKFFDDEKTEFIPVYEGPVADMRGVLEGGPQTFAALAINPDVNPIEKIATKRLVGSGEGKAGGLLMSEENLNKMFANHGDIGRLAVRKIEKMLSDQMGFEVFVDRNGAILRKPSPRILIAKN